MIVMSPDNASTLLENFAAVQWGISPTTLIHHPKTEIVAMAVLSRTFVEQTHPLVLIDLVKTNQAVILVISVDPVNQDTISSKPEGMSETPGHPRH